MADQNNNVVVIAENEENSQGNADDKTLKTIYNHPGTGRKIRSEVWKIFGFYKIREGPATSRDNLDMTKAICRLCRKEYINKGNTTNLQWHIEHDHNQPEKAKPKDQRPVQSVSFIHPVTSKTVQSKLTTSIIDNRRITVSRQASIDDALLKLLVGKVLPLSLVDNHLFQDFVKLLDSRYKIPSRSTVNRALEKTKKQMEERLKEELKGVKDVCITHDGWTSCNTESYSCVTAHFITVDWKLVSAVLQTKKVFGSHTGENIANALLEVKTEWNLPEVIAVTDNAANEKKAFEILNWTRFGCYGHRINLIVKNALSSSKEITHVIAKGRKLVTFFHQSSSANDMLQIKQKLLLKEELHGHKLIMDVPTRWNSTVDMLRRLLEQTPAIFALASETADLSKTAVSTIKSYVFSFDEQSLVERLVEILEPFEKATTIVCADQSPTMHKIVPLLIKIAKCLKQTNDDPECIKKVKFKMSEELHKRCVDVDQDEEIAFMACVLNPMMKNLEFLSENERELAHRLLTEKALEVAHIQVKIKSENVAPSKETLPTLPNLPALEMEKDIEVSTVETGNPTKTKEKVSLSDESDSPPGKRLKSIVNADIDDWLSDVVYIGGSQKSPSEMIHEEIGRYLGCEIADKDKAISILQWWEKNQYLYPKLSILAKKYLSIPASSVPSERVFSLAGQIVSKKRSRMHPSNVDMFIFMNKNMERYWK